MRGCRVSPKVSKLYFTLSLPYPQWIEEQLEDGILYIAIMLTKLTLLIISSPHWFLLFVWGFSRNCYCTIVMLTKHATLIFYHCSPYWFFQLPLQFIVKYTCCLLLAGLFIVYMISLNNLALCCEKHLILLNLKVFLFVGYG